MEKEFVFKKGSVVVETNKGKVRGYAYNGVSVFKGIPYAKAKRFHAPEPLFSNCSISSNLRVSCSAISRLDMVSPSSV